MSRTISSKSPSTSTTQQPTIKNQKPRPHERRQKTTPPFQNLHRLRTPFHLAQKMGKGLGRSQILQ
jgi:hypothetical protein